MSNKVRKNMRNIFIFAILLLITSALFFAQQIGEPKEEPKNDVLENDISETYTPDMPLYKSMIDQIENKNMPYPNGTLKILTKEPLPGIKWDKNSVTGFHAKTSDAGTGVFLMSFKEIYWKSNDIPSNILYYIDSNDATIYNEEVNKLPPMTFTFLENKEYPVLIYWNWTGGLRYKSDSKMFSFKKVNDKPALEAIDHFDVKQYPLNAFYDSKKDSLCVVSSLTGTIIAKDIPLADENIVDYRVRETLVIIDNNIVVGNIEKLILSDKTDKNMRFIWLTRPLKGGKWKTDMMPINKSKYLSALLPKSWGELLYFPEISIHPKILSDGSIIFNSKAQMQQDNERIYIDMIIKQPKSGAPELLTWLIKYSCEDDKLENKTFERYFFPSENGLIENVSVDTAECNELLFDADLLYNSLLFLRGGQLWQLELKGD